MQAESVLWLVSLFVNRVVPPDPHDHDPGIHCQIMLFWVEAAHISYAPSLSFDILDKWNINNQIFNILCKNRTCHGIPDSLFSSSLSRMK
jgi:hypothetical protein